MARQPDNEMRVIVASQKRDLTAFKVQIGEADGSVHEQWFKLSTQSEIACPEQGADIIVKYNVQPAGAGYEQYGPTYWCNEWMPARSDEADVAPAYEKAAQRVDAENAAAERPAPQPTQGQVNEQVYEAAEAATGIAEPKKALSQRSPDPIKPTARDLSTEWNTAVMTAREVLIANQTWTEAHEPITGPQIAAMARDIYYGKEIPTHPEEEPEREFRG